MSKALWDGPMPGLPHPVSAPSECPPANDNDDDSGDVCIVLLWIWLQNSTSGVVVHLAIFFLTDIGVAWIFIFLRKISLVTFCWVGQSCAICWDVPAIKARIGVNSRKRNNARVEKLNWGFYFMKAKSLTIFFTQAEIEKKICQISCTMHISTSDQEVDCPTKPICT